MHKFGLFSKTDLNKYTKIIKRATANIIEKPELLFIVLATFFGLIMVFLMPMFTTPDEPSHFFRAYQISQGEVIGKTINNQTGTNLPFSQKDIMNCTWLPTIKKCPNLFQKVDFNKIAFTEISASAYSPVVYIPQIIGINVGKFIYPSTFSMAIFGRIFNLLAYILIFFWVIKKAKFGKWVYLVIGLFPIAIQQAASMSGDVMTIGLCMLWIMIIGNLFVSDEKITHKNWILLLLLAIGLALTKQTSIVLVAGVLFLPKRVFENSKQRALIILSIIFATFFAAFLWYMVLKHVNFSYSYYLGDSVSQIGQIKSILGHPLTFLIALVHEYIFEGFHSPGISPDFLITSLHSFFSSFSYKLPLFFCSLGYVGLLFAFLYNDRQEKNSINLIKFKRLALVQTILFILSLLATAGALYLSWTPVGSKFIFGVQGRYFLPIIPLLIPLFILIKRHVMSFNTKNKYTIGLIVGGIASINLVFTIILTYKFFYS